MRNLIMFRSTVLESNDWYLYYGKRAASLSSMEEALAARPPAGENFSKSLCRLPEGAMNYYPFHLGDYTSHTAHLEPLEDLAFRRMLDLYYMRESPLPADASEVARLIRMRQAAEQVQTVLAEFFTLTEVGWCHDRCDYEIERMRDKQAKAQASAAASVIARRAKAEGANVSSERSAGAQRTHNKPSTEAELPTPTPTPTPKDPLEVESASPLRGSRLPKDWQLPEEWAEFVRQKRPDLDPVDIANKFADYWHGVPGAKGRKADWAATWRNWVRKENAPLRAIQHSKVARQAEDQSWVAELMDRNSTEFIDLIDAIEVRKSA